MVTSTAHRPNTKLPFTKKWAAYCETKKNWPSDTADAMAPYGRVVSSVTYLCEEHQENEGGETHLDAFGDLQGKNNREGLTSCNGERGGDYPAACRADELTHPGEGEVEEPQPRERHEGGRRQGAQEPGTHGDDGDSVSTRASKNTEATWTEGVARED